MSLEADASILYRFSAALPGVELVEGRSVPRLIRLFHTTYGLATPITGGSARIYRGRSYESAPGSTMITVPGEAHTMLRVAPGTRYVVVRFSPERFNAHAEAMGQLATSVSLSRARVDDPELAGGVRALCAAVADGAPAMLQQELEADVVGLLLSRHADRSWPESPLPPRAFERARELLLSDLGAAVTLDDLALAAGVGKVQLGRLFKRSTGMGAHAFHLAAKLSRAREMLRAGALVGDVAAVLGFADQSHFSRHFKRHFGITPARFARS